MKDAEAETTGQRAEGCNLVAWRIRQALVETGLRSRWLPIIRAGKEDRGIGWCSYTKGEADCSRDRR